jgi:YD repeat-containing protein
MKLTHLMLAACAAAAFVSSARAIQISYSYDSAGRLTSASYGAAGNTTYQYDRNGNLLARVNTVNPFLPLAGKYAGLITGNAGSSAEAGVLSLNVTLSGGFSGTVSLGGKKFKVKGTFDADGNATVDLSGSPAVHLALHLDSGTRQITGTFTGGVTATLTASSAPFSKSKPAPGGAVGKYTALLAATESLATVPKGTGFASVTIGTTGGVKVAGVLADGTKLSEGTSLVTDTQWPLFANLYKDGGFVSGLVSYAPDPGVGEFIGTIEWMKPAVTGGLYTAGFSTELDFSAAHYAPPPKGQPALELDDESPNAHFIAPGIDKPLTLDAKNHISVAEPNPEKLTLKLKAKSGQISGGLLIAGKGRKLSGVLQLEQNIGAGFFFSDSESLPFTLGEN